MTALLKRWMNSCVRVLAGNARLADILPFLDYAANEAVAAGDER